MYFIGKNAKNNNIFIQCMLKFIFTYHETVNMIGALLLIL